MVALLGENARWEVQKDVAHYFKQILLVAFYKTAAVQPLTSYLTNHAIKMRRYVGNTTERSKDKLMNENLKWSRLHTYIERLTFTSFVRSLDTVKRTCEAWWLLETNGEKESRESVLSAHFDDDDHTHTHTHTGGCGVIVIVVGNGLGDMSSNHGRGWFHFT